MRPPLVVPWKRRLSVRGESMLVCQYCSCLHYANLYMYASMSLAFLAVVEFFAIGKTGRIQHNAS